MIHDAIVPVTCDNHKGNCCTREEFILDPPLPHGYTINEYIEDQIERQWWIIINGKHYCSQECADEAEDGK